MRRRFRFRVFPAVPNRSARRTRSSCSPKSTHSRAEDATSFLSASANRIFRRPVMCRKRRSSRSRAASTATRLRRESMSCARRQQTISACVADWRFVPRTSSSRRGPSRLLPTRSRRSPITAPKMKSSIRCPASRFTNLRSSRTAPFRFRSICASREASHSTRTSSKRRSRRRHGS